MLRVISRLNVGGPARQVLWLSRGLESRGYRTTVVSGRIPDNEDSLEGLFEREGVSIVRFPEMEREISPGRDLGAIWKMRALIQDLKPEIIHVHLSKAAFLVRAARALLPDGPPVVYTHHGNRLRGYFSGPKTRMVRWTEKALAPWTDRILVLSPQQKEEISAEMGIGRPAQYRIVPLGVDLSFTSRIAENRGRLRQELGLTPGRLLVGIVGRVAPIKAHGVFVDAAARVLSAWKGANRPFFVVIGSGALEEMRSLEERVHAAGIAADFGFLGTRTDPAAFLADLDVVALTSRNEGTPLSLIEAMAAGRAIVATDVGGVRDLLTREGTGTAGETWRESEIARGKLVPADNVEAFAGVLAEVLRDPETRARMGEAGRLFAPRYLSVERLFSDLDAAYRELLPPGRLPPRRADGAPELA
ncbi:MAG: glycosyltransferase [Acidobacteriota bacterium]